MPKPPRPVSEARTAFYHAVEFEDASLVLNHLFIDRVDKVAAGLPELSEDDSVPVRFGTTLFMPTIMVGAFALEVYLKCLHILDHGTESESGHASREIFYELKAGTQARIRAHHAAIVASRAARRIEDPEGHDVDTSLDDANGAFVAWRYRYEKNPDGSEKWPGGRWLIPTLLNAVRRVILERHPEWSKYSGHLFDEPTGPVP